MRDLTNPEVRTSIRDHWVKHLAQFRVGIEGARWCDSGEQVLRLGDFHKLMAGRRYVEDYPSHAAELICYLFIESMHQAGYIHKRKRNDEPT